VSLSVVGSGWSAVADIDCAPAFPSGIYSTKPCPVAPASVPCPAPFGGAFRRRGVNILQPPPRMFRRAGRRRRPIFGA
jgi:hypothetical protein